MISLQEALALVKLTPAEERTLTKLEAAADALVYARFDGAPMVLQLNEDVPPKIAAAFQRKYEERKLEDTCAWRVQLGKDARSFVLIPTFFGPMRAKREAALPPLVVAQAVAQAHSGSRILVRMPTRGRPRQALDALAKYRAMAGWPIQIEAVIDEDDATMLASPVLQRLNALGCVITVGRHGSKVAAVNGGRLHEWDILVLASDDMIPVVDGYAKRIVEAMTANWPHLDGALHFDDGYQRANCYTLPIIGRRLYEQYDACIYHPAYKSLWCDVEQTETLKAAGRLTYIDDCIIEHRHPAAGKASKDALYERNDALWTADEETFRARQRRGFDTPPLLLSICICTLPVRRAQLERLLDHLWAQILDSYNPLLGLNPHPRMVEILVDDEKNISIGEKRQRLLERSRGAFVAFVDDDDFVSHEYVAEILTAIDKHPHADCVELRGVITTAGAEPEPTHHSIKYTDWHKADGVHCRSPNHLNPIRRKHALAVGFPHKSHAEDFDFSIKLRPLLKVEAPTHGVLYHYWFDPTKQLEGA